MEWHGIMFMLLRTAMGFVGERLWNQAMMQSLLPLCRLTVLTKTCRQSGRMDVVNNQPI